jgi:hypothetical protein
MFLDENFCSLRSIWNAGKSYSCSISTSNDSGISNPDTGSTLRGSNAEACSTCSTSADARPFTANSDPCSHPSRFTAFSKKTLCASTLNSANTPAHNASNSAPLRPCSGSALYATTRAGHGRTSSCDSRSAAFSAGKTGFNSDGLRGGLQF